MGVLTLSEERWNALRRFRRRTWLVIAMCAGLRFADAAFGLGVIEPTASFAAQEADACHAGFDLHQIEPLATT